MSHQGPLSKEHPSYNGSPYNVKVEWENGQFSEEPLSTIAVDAPVSFSIYTKKKGLLDKPGWKHFKHIAKQQGKLFTEAKKTNLESIN